MEIWKPIREYEGLYEASNEGRIRSVDRVVPHKTSGFITLKGRIIKSFSNGKTIHQTVHLSKDKVVVKKYVHRLVYEAFNGPIPEGMEINHKDENPLNNNLLNLEILSHRDNNLYGTKIERQRQKMIGCKFHGNQFVDENHNRLSA